MFRKKYYYYNVLNHIINIIYLLKILTNKYSLCAIKLFLFNWCRWFQWTVLWMSILFIYFYQALRRNKTLSFIRNSKVIMPIISFPCNKKSRKYTHTSETLQKSIRALTPKIHFTDYTLIYLFNLYTCIIAPEFF